MCSNLRCGCDTQRRRIGVARQLIERIDMERAVRATPFVVAIDGRSGAGKSTLAAEVARALAASTPPRPSR